MKKILQSKEKILRKIAEEVNPREIRAPKIRKILREMSQSLKSQFDGVALAAPQIGYPLRIFIVSGKIFEEDFREDRATRNVSLKMGEEEIWLNQNNMVGRVKKNKKQIKDLIFINPKISKLSKNKEWVAEGCLSVRWLYGKTLRSKKALITAYDENGKKFSRGASGLLAQIFQHETEHLDGILFTDHAKEVKEELPK